MILDQFGKPIHQLVTPEMMTWVDQALDRQWRERLEIMRLMDLHGSLGFPYTVTGPKIGDAVSVRMPQPCTAKDGKD